MKKKWRLTSFYRPPNWWENKATYASVSDYPRGLRESTSLSGPNPVQVLTLVDKLDRSWQHKWFLSNCPYPTLGGYWFFILRLTFSSHRFSIYILSYRFISIMQLDTLSDEEIWLQGRNSQFRWMGGGNGSLIHKHDDEVNPRFRNGSRVVLMTYIYIDVKQVAAWMKVRNLTQLTDYRMLSPLGTEAIFIRNKFSDTNSRSFPSTSTPSWHAWNSQMSRRCSFTINPRCISRQALSRILQFVDDDAPSRSNRGAFSRQALSFSAFNLYQNQFFKPLYWVLCIKFWCDWTQNWAKEVGPWGNRSVTRLFFVRWSSIWSAIEYFLWATTRTLKSEHMAGTLQSLPTSELECSGEVLIMVEQHTIREPCGSDLTEKTSKHPWNSQTCHSA